MRGLAFHEKMTKAVKVSRNSLAIFVKNNCFFARELNLDMFAFCHFWDFHRIRHSAIFRFFWAELAEGWSSLFSIFRHRSLLPIYLF